MNPFILDMNVHPDRSIFPDIGAYIPDYSRRKDEKANSIPPKTVVSFDFQKDLPIPGR